MNLEVGDGTTTVTILAGELLKECKTFVEDGVHPQVASWVSGVCPRGTSVFAVCAKKTEKGVVWWCSHRSFSR